MKVLVVGGGGREHALCWKLKQSPLLDELFCTPGSAAISELATCCPGDPLEVARELRPDLVVVGPEAPLAAGLVDQLQQEGIASAGPTRQAAQLESSKAFCKGLLQRHGIPTAGFRDFTDMASATRYVDEVFDGRLVIKADGLAAGKGVVVAESADEARQAVASLFEVSPRILVEQCLEGEEISLMALTDGETILPLAPAQDHKRLGEGDTGPNTGGMGCYSPVPSFTPALLEEAVTKILQPTLAALRAEGITYRGVLYAGLMATATGLQVLEYNCRFGDPETQVVLPRLESDLLPLLLACAGSRMPSPDPSRVQEGGFVRMPSPDLSRVQEGGFRLADMEARWRDEAAVCVVLAAAGYPASDYRRGDVISGLREAESKGALVFHSGTVAHDGVYLSRGGRVLAVSALGEDFLLARCRCYEAVDTIYFEGAYHRRDIGWRCL